MSENKVELHIVIDKHGINCVQIVGSVKKQDKGHNLYFKINDLIYTLDKDIQKRLINSNSEATYKVATD